jgi:hypothetical protein
MFSYKQFFIAIFIICPIFISCNSLNCNKEYSENIFDKEFFFILDYNKSYIDCPVVFTVINDKKYYFSIDTGSSVNKIYKRGIEKTYGSMRELDKAMVPVFINANKNTEYRSEYEIKKDLHTYYKNGGITINMALPDTDGLNGNKISFIVSPYEKESVDGVLGLPFLQRYSAVVFDYTNKLIKFTDKPISTGYIPMRLYFNSLLIIDFQADSFIESGIIDTGNGAFVIRKEFEKGTQLLSDDAMIEYLKKDIPQKTRTYKIEKVKRIQIGENVYSDVNAVYGDYVFAYATEKTRQAASVCNSLGYTFWKDHIIQLDFKNMIFRIK